MMHRKNQTGQIIIVSLVFMSIALTLVGSLVIYTLVQVKSHRQAVGREKGLSIAEAGVEAAIWKLNHQAGYTGESNTTYGAGTYTVAITNLSGSSKLIKVDSYIPSSSNPRAHRQVQITATIGTKNIAFNYGLQVGNGGLKMDNNSTVNGNVYSNGIIDGSNNNAVITGDAVVAGNGTMSGVEIGGNTASHWISDSTVGKDANHFHLDNTIVDGNASVNDMANCTIKGNATFNANSSCTVLGTSTNPNNNVPTDPVALPLPIDQTQITDWQQEATNGGVIATQTINGTSSLGPIKINGNLTVNGTLTITGTIWVTGNVTFTNGSIIQLSSSFGSLSGLLIAGTFGSTTTGYINLNNGAQVLGSGTAGSFLMLLSERDTTASTAQAITAANTVSAAILYANNGTVEVVNNAGLKEITAWKVHLNNNATVTYDVGLASSQFSSGPGGGWQVSDQTWQLLR